MIHDNLKVVGDRLYFADLDTVELAKKYSNIVAVKQSNGDLDLISELKNLCPNDFVIYFSSK